VQQDISETRRERLLKMLAAATFIIFFQGYMVAPIIPTLSSTFGSSIQTAFSRTGSASTV
jgi:predicted MFS family arabinose efflux permease